MTADFDIIGALRFEPPSGDTSGVGRRQAFRAVPPGLKARVKGTLDSFEVNDISASGICMTVPEIAFAKGRVLHLDLFIAGSLFLKDLEALVIRAVPGECACAFQNLVRRHELKLDKLVLELQKREIIRRRQEREAEKALPDGASEAADGGAADDSGDDTPPIINLPL